MSRYITSILEFIAALRRAGLNIGLSESMAAIEALEHVGLEDRGAVRIALAACLAKSEEDRRVLSREFDAYFVGEQEKELRSEHEIRRAKVRQEKLDEGAKELVFQDAPLDLSENQLEIYASLGESEKARIQDFLEKTSSGKNVSPKFKFVAEQVVKSKLNAVGAKNDQAGEGETNLLYKNIAAISDDEVPQVMRLIHAIVRRINGAISRKTKRTGKRRTIDIKGTIHNSLHTGGVFYKLRFKAKPLRRQRLLLLCDVSASMYRFSGFVLQFILGMYTVADKTISYLFSEGVERVQREDLASMKVFEQRVTGSGLWNKGTNIATALEALLASRDNPLGSSTVVMIVSDAKTLETQRTCDLLSDVAKRSRRILWLNPIAEQNWASMPWLACFREHCVMLDCSTIDRLATVCAQSPDLLS